MRADDIASLDAVGLADLVRRRAASPVELLDAAVDAIERTNPALNAVVWTDVARARAAIAAGLPDVRLPWSVDDGTATGVQVAAALGREDLLFGLAGQIERARPWADLRPPSPPSAKR